MTEVRQAPTLHANATVRLLLPCIRREHRESAYHRRTGNGRPDFRCRPFPAAASLATGVFWLLIVLQLIFAIHRYRSLRVDAVIAARATVPDVR